MAVQRVMRRVRVAGMDFIYHFVRFELSCRTGPLAWRGHFVTCIPSPALSFVVLPLVGGRNSVPLIEWRISLFRDA